MEEMPHHLPPHHSRILRLHGILASVQATKNSREVKVVKTKRMMLEEILKDAKHSYRHHWTLRMGRISRVPIESTSLRSIAAISKMALMCNDRINQHRSSKLIIALMVLKFVLNVGRAHLYRHHRHFPCPRRKVLFQSQEEVILHLGKPEICEFRDSKQDDGITSEVVERLRCKKKTRKGQSEEEC